MHILHLISSPRKQASYSIQLGIALVEKLMTDYPDSTVRIHNLASTPFPHLEEAHLQSFNTTPEDRTPEQQMAVRHRMRPLRN